MILETEMNRICSNCACFFQDKNDFDSGFGVCMMRNADEFEPYLDDGIMESSDFSACHDLYMEKRLDGERNGCDKYEEIETIDLPEGMDLSTYLALESALEEKKHRNVDDLVQRLREADSYESAMKAFSSISYYMHLGNQNAYNALLSYYMSLGPAESLDDVHIRVEIVEDISSKGSAEDKIKAFVHELARTPSNNMTRQLYTAILRELCRCPAEMVREPLLVLLDRVEYSYRIKKRMKEIVETKEHYELW